MQMQTKRNRNGDLILEKAGFRPKLSNEKNRALYDIPGYSS